MAPIFVGSNNEDSRIRSNRIGFAASTADPGSLVTGDAYYNSTDNQLKIYDGSALSPVSGGGGTVELVASGTLSNGQTVIIQSDGTVAGVTTSQVTTGIAGTETFNAEQTYVMDLGYDPVNDKFLIIYPDESSNSTKAVVGTVNADSNTISFGSEVTFLSSKTEKGVPILYDDTNNVFITIYRSGGAIGYLKGKTATISGDSVTFGTEQTPSVGVTNPEELVAAFDTKNAVFAVSTRTNTNNYYGRLHLGQVSNGQLSWSSNTGTFTSYMTEGVGIGYDKIAEKFLVAYKNQISNTGQSRVATITPGTNPSVSFGSEVQLTGSAASYIDVEYSPTAEKLLVAYRQPPNHYPFARVATISGTSVSYGTEVQISTYSSSTPKLAYNTTTTNIDMFDNGNPSVVRSLSISGTAVTTTGSTASANARVNAIEFIYASNSDRGVIIGNYDDDTHYGAAAVYIPEYVATNLTSENFIGFSDAAYSDGQTAKIQVVSSVDDAQTGLTTGSQLYVQQDGSLGTTADTPSVFGGTALSATKISIKN